MFLKEAKKFQKFWPKKRGFGLGVRLGQSMLGNISYKRNIGKNTKLLFLKKEEITKKQEICQGVWLGESMIGNRFGQVIQFKKMQALF